MEKHKISQLESFQAQNLRWYMVLTKGGIEIPEQYCPHYTDIFRCEIHSRLYPETELNNI